MAGPDFNSFFGAIAGQESGGNYQAINGNTGALGKYQILPGNVPGWSAEYLGQSWTPQQFLSDPRKQDALARAVLQDYYNKYGPRGAASAWYSGNPNLAGDYNRQGNYPSIGEYVDQVMGRAGNPSAYISPSDPFAGIRVHNLTVGDTQYFPVTPNDKKAIVGSGMGAATAPGVDAVDGANNGAQAVSGAGSEAVGDTSTDGKQPSLPNGQLPDGQGPVTQATPVGGYVSSQGRHMALMAGLDVVGTPYVWGGGGANGPTRNPSGAQTVGFDCSGLVQYMFAKAGITMPRLSYDQLAMGPKAPINSLEPGDLVGFGDGHHVAIYLGGGQILEAPHTGAAVRTRALGQGEDAWGVSMANLYH